MINKLAFKFASLLLVATSVACSGPSATQSAQSVDGNQLQAAQYKSANAMVIEAENFRSLGEAFISEDGPFVVMTDNGAITTSATIPAGSSHEVVVRAQSDFLNKVGARMVVKIGSVTVADQIVNSQSFVELVFRTKLASGSQQISIAFTNDAYNAKTGQDRNLYVDWISIEALGGAATPTPTATPAPTATPRPTATPTPVPTPVATATPPPQSGSGYQFPVSLVSQSSRAMTGIATFNSIGLYWKAQHGRSGVDALLRFREKGSTAWRQGHPLWFDSRNSAIPADRRLEFRGSMVDLRAATEYEIQAVEPSTGEYAQATVRTWSESFPVAKTVELPVSSASQLNITESGTSSGYVLYTFKAGSSATIDVANKAEYNININASYIIIRGLTLKGAKTHGIFVGNSGHDIVIENNDISGWGSNMPDGLGREYDSGVATAWEDNTSGIVRLIIQRNKIRNPRTNSNNWTQPRPSYDNDPHPYGAQGISLFNTGGNHVIRYNDILGDETHHFNDGIGGASNFSYEGVPGKDSDIYGNKIMYAWDDCIEAEGGNANVRIYNNYLDKCYVMIAHAVTSVGPNYDFRNVLYRTEISPGSNRGVAWKLPSPGTSRGGRNYIYHNTTYRTNANDGVEGGLVAVGDPILNTVTRNNIINTRDSFIYDGGLGAGNSFDYDIYNGSIDARDRSEANGINALAIYDGSTASGPYAPATNSRAFDTGLVIPNFNDGFVGLAPDRGAQERGASALIFGVR